MGPRDETYRHIRNRIHKLLGVPKFTWKGFEEMKKIEVHVGISERLVGDFAIEEALQIEIKATIANNNQSYMQ